MATIKKIRYQVKVWSEKTGERLYFDMYKSIEEARKEIDEYGLLQKFDKVTIVKVMMTYEDVEEVKRVEKPLYKMF